MNLILNNLRAVAVNIDYNLLKEDSYQLEDYTLVMDNRPVDYKMMMEECKKIEGSPQSTQFS